MFIHVENTLSIGSQSFCKLNGTVFYLCMSRDDDRILREQKGVLCDVFEYHLVHLDGTVALNGQVKTGNASFQIQVKQVFVGLSQVNHAGEKLRGMYVIVGMCKRNLLPFFFGNALCFQFLNVELVGNVSQDVEVTCSFAGLKHILVILLGELSIDFCHKAVFKQAGLQIVNLSFTGKGGTFSFHLKFTQVSGNGPDGCISL